MIGFIIIVIVIIIVVAVLKAIFSKPKQYSYSVNVHSDTGVRFWINIDNIVQNQQSVPSLSILNIPFVEDTYSVMDIYMDLGNGRMAKANEKPVVLNKCVSRYFILHQTNKGTFVLQPAKPFVGQAQVPCCGTNPTQIQYEQYEQPQPSVPQKKQPARKKAPVSKEAAAAQAAANAAKAAAAAAEKAAKAASEANKKADGFCTDRQFKNILKDLDGHYMDDDKVEIIKKHVAKKNLHVSQLIELVNKLIYDDSKVEVLLFAYPYCNEKRHYRDTLSSLRYSFSKEKVEEMITKRKR